MGRIGRIRGDGVVAEDVEWDVVVGGGDGSPVAVLCRWSVVYGDESVGVWGADFLFGGAGVVGDDDEWCGDVVGVWDDGGGCGEVGVGDGSGWPGGVVWVWGGRGWGAVDVGDGSGGRVTTMSYDSGSGLLDGITTAGQGTDAVNTFDGSGRIRTQVDAEGHVWEFAWADSNDLTAPEGSGVETVTDPAGGVIKDWYWGNVRYQHRDGEGGSPGIVMMVI